MYKQGPDIIKHHGRIIQMIERPTDLGSKVINFEIARRAPGVRVIIRDGEKFLLSKEYRFEHDTFDYRLPGGKVLDKLDDYLAIADDKEKLLEAATKAAIREAEEEVGLTILDPQLFHISPCGTTMTWDLYYFVVDKYEELPEGTNHEPGEEHTTHDWYAREQVIEFIKDGAIKEDRSIGILAKLLL